MTAFTENIRKMMGWCPNARAFETRKPVQFDNISAGASGGIDGAIRKISEMQGIKAPESLSCSAFYLRHGLSGTPV